MNLIEERIESARKGTNPYVIIRLKSGWVMIGDVQPLEGYCLLLADPVVESINALSEEGRKQYCLDMARIGDALLKVTKAYRINYETWGNSEPALHTHIMPRYMHEPDEIRCKPACMSYDWKTSRAFSPETDLGFIEAMRQELAAFALQA